MYSRSLTFAKLTSCRVDNASARATADFRDDVVVTQVLLHGIRLSQRELHQMNVPDVKVETQNASIRNDEGSASLVKSVKA